MKVETKYVRSGKTIKDLESGKSTSYKTINAAKKESRKLQGTQLGQGLVRVA